jgi:hypothetical protein
MIVDNAIGKKVVSNATDIFKKWPESVSTDFVTFTLKSINGSLGVLIQRFLNFEANFQKVSSLCDLAKRYTSLAHTLIFKK